MNMTVIHQDLAGELDFEVIDINRLLADHDYRNVILERLKEVAYGARLQRESERRVEAGR
jgi:hypothetical protein